MSFKRSIMVILIIGAALLVPIRPEGVQGTSLGLVINRGIEAYDGLFNRTPPYTVCTASGDPVETPRGPVIEFDTESDCVVFESAEDMEAFLDGRIFHTE